MNKNQSISPIRFRKFDRADQGLVEVNDTCNISCFGCYKDKRESLRTIEDICRDIDDLASRRVPEFIAIAGGEPTLYPHLPEIIRYAAKRFRKVGMLTNGTTLTSSALNNYKNSGLSSIFIHIDSSQENRKDLHCVADSKEQLDQLRIYYAHMCHSAGIPSICTMTLYPDTLHELKPFIESTSANASHSLHGALLFAYSAGIDRAGKDFERSLENRTIADFLNHEYGFKPLFYLPSNKNPDKWCWLFYSLLITKRADGSTEKLCIDPEHRFFAHMANLFMCVSKKRSSTTYSPRFFSSLMITASYFLFCFSLTKMKSIAKFMASSLSNKNLRFQFYIFQKPPNTQNLDDPEICFNCPDAVMRDSRLIPVCMADRLLHTNTKISMKA